MRLTVAKQMPEEERSFLKAALVINILKNN
jgi:hypothetical protein